MINWCLRPTLAVFQLYRGIQSVWMCRRTTNIQIQLITKLFKIAVDTTFIIQYIFIHLLK